MLLIQEQLNNDATAQLLSEIKIEYLQTLNLKQRLRMILMFLPLIQMDL